MIKSTLKRIRAVFVYEPRYHFSCDFARMSDRKFGKIVGRWQKAQVAHQDELREGYRAHKALLSAIEDR